MSDQEDIFAAIKSGDSGAVAELIAEDRAVAAARTPEGVSALMLALYFAQGGIAEQIEAQLEEVDFFEAVALGRKDSVEDWVRTSPDLIGRHAPDGFTGLHLATFFGHPEIVELLLENVADPDIAATGSMNVRPLHSAAAGRKPEAIVPIVQALLSSGANINCAQNGGFTALHAAGAAGNQDLLQLLIEKGADVAAKTDAGKNALDLALEKGHESCAEVLKAQSGS
jgi:ankyrin repeat protein